MTQQPHLPRRRFGAAVAPLAFLAALLIVFPVAAAAPPAQKPPLPAPGPLFDPEEIHTDPVRMALAVVSASTTPAASWAVVATVAAGEHPRVRAWELKGVLTNLYTRRACGASTAFLNGFSGDAAGLGSLSELATLKVGDYLNCWALRDTDRFHNIPKAWLAVISDGRGIPVGNVEAEVYAKVLTAANYTSAAAFKKAARKDITYTHYYNEPDVYRGTVVHVEGKLRRIRRYEPPPEAAQAGVNDLYEAWVFSEYLGTNPYCVVFTEWPANLPRDLLGEGKISDVYVVKMDGYFFKKFGYQSNDGRNSRRDAPLVIGHALLYDGHPVAKPEKETAWLGTITTVIVGGFTFFVCMVLGLTYWFRRTDNNIRRRLLATRGPEFVLPPPDAMPVAPPVGAPVKRLTKTDRTTLPSRITFIAGSGDRGGESTDPGGKRGPGDKPPDEGDGARPGP